MSRMARFEVSAASISALSGLAQVRQVLDMAYIPSVKLGPTWGQNWGQIGRKAGVQRSKVGRFNETLAEACGSRTLRTFHKSRVLTTLQPTNRANWYWIGTGIVLA